MNIANAGISIAQPVDSLPGREVRVMRSLRWVVLLAIFATLMVPGKASAQSRRVVRRPVTRSVIVVAARPYYRPYYYAPWYGFYGSYAGWYGWYPSPYYWQYPYPYGRYYYDYTSSARL